MSGETLVAEPSHALLEELRARLTRRLATLEERIRGFEHDLEALQLERITVQAELRVLEDRLRS